MLASVNRPRPLDLPQNRYRLKQLRRSPLLKLGDSPGKAIGLRILFAIGLLLIVTTITWVDGASYSDSQGDDPLTFIDALYYSTVTVTTTGYGDIVPATQEARLLTTIVVTPIRVLFLILLVGTTLQVLADQSLFNRRRRKWQKSLTGHTVICGFGIKGRSALLYLSNHDPDQLAVAIDESEEALEAANDAGAGGIRGSSLETETLRAAGVESAAKVIVALNSDDDSVVTVLRVKELNPSVKIVASCREQKNEELLFSSGADEVIVSSSSAGRILGMAAQAPDAARIVNDLLTFGDGLDINERLVAAPGEPLETAADQTAIAVIRAAAVLRPGQEGTQPLEPGDRVIFIDSNTGENGRPADADL
jgi:voltage-gated potassium channel